jgi:hypothetical protein
MCDDGGSDAGYSGCDYGTDCFDCGARDRNGAPNESGDAFGSFVPGLSIGPIMVGSTYGEAVAILGPADDTLPGGISGTLNLYYYAVGLVLIAVDGDLDEQADPFETLDHVLARAPFAGTYSGLGIGSSQSELVAVMGPPDKLISTDNDWYLYRTRGISWTVSDGFVETIMVFAPL